ncbi:unnamed protein product [Rotaria sordida]|uniref:DNA-directed RNA polymerase n=1 Tax=Rotaria sordida TaxID=392033 RepID=A0A819Q5B2_9BILA|nr:unnamed protein product [Rotaria sordida]
MMKIYLKITDATKIRMIPFINYSRFFDLHRLTNLLKSKDINQARSIMVQTWRNLSDDKRQQYNYSAITERLDDLIRNYITTHGKLDQTNMDKRTFEKMIHFKSLKSSIDPGESVEILAAQSIGEPSTQMTLNKLAEKDDDDDDDDDDNNNNNEENETDNEETMQDNQDENDQTNTSKITIKENVIDDDDDDDVQALDISKEEMNNDDEQEVPGNDEDNIDEPPIDLDNNLWCRLTMVFPPTQPDRLKNNILTYINRLIETFDENVYMKIHLQYEFCRICALDDYLRQILSPNFTQ